VKTQKLDQTVFVFSVSLQHRIVSNGNGMREADSTVLLLCEIPDLKKPTMFFRRQCARSIRQTLKITFERKRTGRVRILGTCGDAVIRLSYRYLQP